MLKILYAILILSILNSGVEATTTTCDILIYGGTSAGITAAIQAKRLGKSVILIHSGKHVGGATANGLGFIDSNNHSIIGGIAREFFHRIWTFYQNDAVWKFETAHPIMDQKGMPDPHNETMWVVEPHVAERIFKAMLQAAKVPVVLEEKLDLVNGVEKNGEQIVQLKMLSGNIYQAKVFIDATYEGDLMAAAKVSYIVGREANSLYGETYNGVQSNVKSSFPLKIDPYKTPGDPSSGLLPRIYPNAGGNHGEADQAVQAYCYRMCLTNVPENRMMIPKPNNYDEWQYEIVFRAVEAGQKDFFKLSLLPNIKTDSNNTGLVSTDFIGMSWNWAESDYDTRKQIALEHENWQKGLVWTLQNHPRIPQELQHYYAPWGLPLDEFIENNHWPYELYVREARRMISSFVINENTAYGVNNRTDGVALATYEMDSHYIKYYVSDNRTLAGEGGLYKKIPHPLPISYQAIVPKMEECQNLIVPVCLSATHVAYGSIRMEPTFMVLGQSAATAASLAIDLGTSVQEVPYDRLRTQLLANGQKLN